MEAEEILEKHARKNMVFGDQEAFKKSYSQLHKSIIASINEALTIK